MHKSMDELLTLDNCDREPIHIPGLIQSHGALFAFDPSGRLMYRSQNAEALLGPGIPALGQLLGAGHFTAYQGLHELLERVAAAVDGNGIGHAMKVDCSFGLFHVIAHKTGQGMICEFEDGHDAIAEEPGFAFSAHRAMERLRRQTTVEGLLSAAVEEIRRLTGFDRVMAYRFLHDGSGAVAAESAHASLEPFMGRRYPASDIPAQARRLYVINTLRLIADVRATPVAVEALPGTVEPLDMSHSVLRSVSPVHIEYLGNMGVAASMSISIVIGGKLWGMLACHHRLARRVSYTVRMACDVMGQILGANIQGALAKQYAVRSDKAANFRSHLLAQALHEQDLSAALSTEAGALCDSFGAQGVLLADGGKLEVYASLAPSAATALLQWLNDGKPVAGHMVHLHTLDGLPAPLRAHMGVWCGLLALPFGAEPLSWMVLLRKEQVETVLWGGRPEKDVVAGPLGPRLTPRGSFDLWRQIVQGHAIPWDDTDLDSAQKLLDKLLWVESARSAETSRARSHLMAMLGHDLRDPLQAIANTATLIGTQGGDGTLTQRIKSSSTRMQRLISQVMDMSQLQNGGLVFHMELIDLAAVLKELIAESRAARPSVKIETITPPRLMAEADGDRIAQVLGNLLGNASQHAFPGSPVLVQLRDRGGTVEIEVSNEGNPPSGAVAATLFQAFKRAGDPSAVRRNGLGLGLYIAQQIMLAHGGTLGYASDAPYVVFTATFPARRDKGIVSRPAGIA